MIPGLLLGVPLHSCAEDEGGSALRDLSAAQIVEAVLEHCHGPLRGEMDRSLLELREGEAPPTTIAAWLPDRLRMDTREAVEILVKGAAWRCPAEKAPVRLEGSGLEAIVRMREFVRGMLLIPLYEMRTASRSGDDVVLELAGGEEWQLKLREGTLLPESLVGPVGEVRFVDYRETSVSRFPQRVVLGDLGEREIRFRAAGVFYSELLFADPEAEPGQAAGENPPAVSLSAGRDHRPRVPEITEIRDAFWLVLDDPTSWERRSELVMESHIALHEQGQILAGFTGFVEENGRRLMIVPFRPDPDRGSRPLVRREGQTVRRVPAHRALVSYPDRGALPDTMDAGRKQLSDHVRENALEVAGPIRFYPYIFVEEGAPTAEILASVDVRVEQPIR